MRVALLIFITLLNSFYGLARASEQCSVLGTGINFMPTDTELWVKQAQYFSNVLASKDLKSFCEWNRMDRSSRGFYDGEEKAFQDKYKMAALSGDDESAANSILEYHESGAWDRSMMGHSILKNSEYKGSNPDKKLRYQEEKAARISYRKKIEKSFALAVPADAKFELLDYDKMRVSNNSPGTIERLAACGQFVGVLSVNSCVGALGEVEAYVRVHMAGAAITGVESLKKVQTKEYAEGLRRAVALVYAHFHEKPIRDGANVFEDLKMGFMQAGIEAGKAEDMAYESLAAISTGGPNFFQRTVNKGDIYMGIENSKNYSAVALQAIAVAMIDLDTNKMQNASPSLYSIPNEVKFPCDSGKYYHFWMEAYLSRRLKKLGYSDEVARAAPFIAHVGYQLSDNFGQRKASNQLTTRRYGASENGVRIDMTLASMGTAFGVDGAMGKSRVINGEMGYSKFLEAGGFQASLTGDEADSWFTSKKTDAAFRFMDNLNPQFVFDQYK